MKEISTWTTFSLILFIPALFSCSGANNRFPGELCENGIDDNENGLIDCEDTESCANLPVCLCGNQTLDTNEECDGTLFLKETCESLGFLGGGDLACDSFCQLDIRNCIQSEQVNCQNGLDDDDDGSIDCQDQDCFLEAVCKGTGTSCQSPLLSPDPSLANGDLGNAINLSESSCQFFDGVDQVFQVVSSNTGHLNIDLSENTDDLGLFVQSSCGDPSSELACSDVNLAGRPESLFVEVEKGQEVFVFVGGFSKDHAGTFSLTIASEIAELCNNRTDDDKDGLIDCEDVSDCAQNPTCQEIACIQNAILANPPFLENNDLINSANLSDSSCQLPGGPDQVYHVIASVAGILNVIVTPTDSSDLGIFVQTICGNNDSEIACVDLVFLGEPEFLLLPVQAGEEFFVFVGGFSSLSNGSYEVEILLE